MGYTTGSLVDDLRSPYIRREWILRAADTIEALSARATAAEAERDRLAAEAAAMREALARVLPMAKSVSLQTPIGNFSDRVMAAERALATTAGVEMLERVRRMDVAIGAIRSILRRYAAIPDDGRAAIGDVLDSYAPETDPQP